MISTNFWRRNLKKRIGRELSACFCKKSNKVFVLRKKVVNLQSQNLAQRSIFCLRIGKKHLRCIVLANWNPVNSFVSIETLQHWMSTNCTGGKNSILSFFVCISTGLQCCCFMEQAIPEPQLAEQQQGCPAFFVLKIKLL